MKRLHLAGLRAGRAFLPIVTRFGSGAEAIVLAPFQALLSASAPNLRIHGTCLHADCCSGLLLVICKAYCLNRAYRSQHNTTNYRTGVIRASEAEEQSSLSEDDLPSPGSAGLILPPHKRSCARTWQPSSVQAGGYPRRAARSSPGAESCVFPQF
jgi:hypothetical protein